MITFLGMMQRFGTSTWRVGTDWPLLSCSVLHAAGAGGLADFGRLSETLAALDRVQVESPAPIYAAQPHLTVGSLTLGHPTGAVIAQATPDQDDTTVQLWPRRQGPQPAKGTLQEQTQTNNEDTQSPTTTQRAQSGATLFLADSGSRLLGTPFWSPCLS
jgi:hypothetical protein